MILRIVPASVRVGVLLGLNYVGGFEALCTRVSLALRHSSRKLPRTSAYWLRVWGPLSVFLSASFSMGLGLRAVGFGEKETLRILER